MLSFLNTQEFHLEHLENQMVLFGTGDSHLKLIENELNVSITTRGETIRITGNEEDIKSAESVIRALNQMVQKRITISSRDVSLALAMEKRGTIEYFTDLYKEEITKNAKGKPIRVKTLGQREYVQSIKKNQSCIWDWSCRYR